MLFKSSRISNKNHLLPTKLYKSIQFFGIPIEQEESSSNQKIKRQNCLRNIPLRNKIMFFISHIPIFLRILQGSLELHNPIYFITSLFDYSVYLIAFYIMFKHRRKIAHCIVELKKIHHPNLQPLKPKKTEHSSILLLISFLFSCIFFMYGIIYYSKLQTKYIPRTSFQICFQILKLINWALYCLFIFGGISTQTALFVHISSLIYENLIVISRVLDKSFKTDECSKTVLIHQRKLFCNIQKTTSMFNAVFRDIIFIWLLKIIIRCCVSAYEILTIPWTDINMVGLGIFGFDTVYDILHLIVIAFYGGRIIDGKDIVMQSLIGSSRFPLQPFDEAEKELHFFVTLLGQSHIGLTASDIFYVTRKIIVTGMGSIFSYYVLIFQLTSK